MRSLLFVPGDSERKLQKALVSAPDVLVVDLEDSVAQANKPAARAIAADFLQGLPTQGAPRIHVRLNDLSTGLTDQDLAAVMKARPEAVMLPKCNAGADVWQLSAMLRVHEADNGIADGSTRITAIVTETAAGVLAARSYKDSNPRLAALTWGAEDLSAAVGAHGTRDDTGVYTDLFRLARSMTLLAASAAEVDAIDTVFVDFRDTDGLRQECRTAMRDGFSGKMAIHPDQVPIINEAFTPSAAAIEQSREIVRAFAEAGDAGVVALNGRMYDRPHLRRAERILARAEGRT